ncbi:hypothetical protein CMI37_27585 [Candidatus Pacearchaeota archaeon]|nr:hypothetical protein [Candidatus Pacearchaeota archaeon]
MTKTYSQHLKDTSLGFLDGKLKQLVNFGKYGYKALEEIACFALGLVLSPVVIPVVALVAYRKGKK